MKRFKWLTGGGLVTALLHFSTTARAAAAATPAVDTGDTAWVLTSGGARPSDDAGPRLLLRRARPKKEHALGPHAVLHPDGPHHPPVGLIVGYSLAFGPDVQRVDREPPLDGPSSTASGLSPNPDYAPTIPHQAFMIYQAMFAIITPGLHPRRLRRADEVLGLRASSPSSGPPSSTTPSATGCGASGGFLKAAGTLDFAGGTVVHVNAGVAALAAALVLGKRQGYPTQACRRPTTSPSRFWERVCLWFGWFGFNAGSALWSGALATSAFVGHPRWPPPRPAWPGRSSIGPLLHTVTRPCWG
jgi:Amt family ammonium transporter